MATAHTSKLSTFVIDCQTDDLDGAAAFWAQALRRPLNPPQAGDDRYRDLSCMPAEPLLMIQRVAHESRIHLDIESDDIDAEVARLEVLGARRLERVRTWVVMEAPTGQRFCVVRQQRAAVQPPPFAAAAEHERLRVLAGHYRGRTRTWLDPEKEPEECDGELYVEEVLGGRWLRLQEYGTVAGQRHAGEMLLGYHKDAARFELSWVDSFHTGSAMLWSTGEARQDGLIAVSGTYLADAATGERWGWRTEIQGDGGAELLIRAYNLSPEDQGAKEWPAIEARWTRR